MGRIFVKGSQQQQQQQQQQHNSVLDFTIPDC